MEVRDLYDVNRKFLGKTIKKGEKVPKDTYYLVVFAIIEDNGKYLIQKRTKDKGGKWAFTAGHPLSGEDSFTGLIREVKEELGIDISNEKIDLIKTEIEGSHIIDIYHIKLNLDEQKIILQNEEVEEYKIVDSFEIQKLINEGIFHKRHAEHYEELKNNNEYCLFKNNS